MRHTLRLQACLVATALLAACDRSSLASKVADTAIQATPAPAAPTGMIHMCPMDKDVRSNAPGKCPKCGMELTTNVPEPIEYHLELNATPAAKPDLPVSLRFAVFDPWNHNYDDIKFPKPGVYRVLGDFYPEASVPQLVTKTIFVAGNEPPAPPLVADLSPKQAENLGVKLEVLPEQPIAGIKTRLHFTLSTADGLQKYLGVWSHMLAASDDLIDMMHTHPFLADGGPELYFNVIFPRPRSYRVWVQFLRKGVVNTAHYDVSVAPQDDEEVGPGQ